MNEQEQLLQQLHDIELQPFTSLSFFSELALGWWLLAVLLILFLLLAWLWVRLRRNRRWYHEACDELEQIRAAVINDSTAITVSRCSALARRVALVANEREAIASVAGEPWLQELDRLCGKPLFTQGIGRMLLDMPYRKEPGAASGDLDDLFDSLKSLIESVRRQGRSVQIGAGRA